MNLYEVVSKQRYEPTLEIKCRESVEKALAEFVMVKKTEEGAHVIRSNIESKLSRLAAHHSDLTDYKVDIKPTYRGFTVRVDIKIFLQNPYAIDIELQYP